MVVRRHNGSAITRGTLCAAHNPERSKSENEKFNGFALFTIHTASTIQRYIYYMSENKSDITSWITNMRPQCAPPPAHARIHRTTNTWPDSETKHEQKIRQPCRTATTSCKQAQNSAPGGIFGSTQIKNQPKCEMKACASKRNPAGQRSYSNTHIAKKKDLSSNNKKWGSMHEQGVRKFQVCRLDLRMCLLL